jgi:hypothetical protein
VELRDRAAIVWARHLESRSSSSSYRGSSWPWVEEVI